MGLGLASGPEPNPSCPQKLNFNANCMLRLSSSVDVILPAVGLPMFAFGNPNPGWLNRLNASHRNSMFDRPEIANFFDSDVSKFACPGPYRMPRPALPYVFGGGATNALVSNH